MKKKYIIVGDNNYWYATTRELTEKELKDEIEIVKDGINNDIYEHSNSPTELFVYEVKEKERIEL